MIYLCCHQLPTCLISLTSHCCEWQMMRLVDAHKYTSLPEGLCNCPMANILTESIDCGVSPVYSWRIVMAKINRIKTKDINNPDP